MRDTITTADLADMLGVTTRTIRDLKTRAIIVAAGRNFSLVESLCAY